MRYFFATIGIVLLGVACWHFWRRLTVLGSGGVTTTGRVESYESSEVDNSVSYFPVVSFTDNQGNRQRFRAAVGRSSKTLPVGTEVEVRYDSENPKTAFISSFFNMWAEPMLYTVVGIVWLLAFKGL